MVKENIYVPEQGDIIFMDYEKGTTGHEQVGRRSGLVVSSKMINNFVGICFLCPITNTDRGLPFQVNITKNKTTGVIMCEQMKSYDFKKRKAKFVEKINNFELEETLEILRGFLL